MFLAETRRIPIEYEVNEDGRPAVDWTPIALIAFAALTIADLLFFRVVFPPHTAEGALMRVLNGLSWTFAVLLLVFAFAWFL